MNRIRYVVGVIGLWGRLALGAQPVTDPVAELFTPPPPSPPGVADTPAVLRPPEPAAAAPAAVPGVGRAMMFRPPFVLRPGDRVLFLGDALLVAEAEYGYLETRLDSHYPGSGFTFRNLSRSPHNRLREPDPRVAAADTNWLAPLLDEVRAVHPTVVLLSYGTAAAARGAECLPAFTNVYRRVLHGLKALGSNTPPRLVLLGPLSYEPAGAATIADITNRNATFQLFDEAAFQLTVEHNAEYVELFRFSRGEVVGALRAADRGQPRPRLTVDGVQPTAHGLRRLSLALDRGLHWPGNIWRWGLMADGKWRDGGFGAVIRSHERREDYVKVVFTEERLPTPPAPVELVPEEGWEPVAYMQVRSLKDGLYELRVDGQPVLTGTHADWHRYRTLQQGPSWEQAEQLRRTIVEKNRLWETWWAAQRDRPAAQRAEPHPRLAELEARLRELKRPREHTYEIVRISDAPPGTPDLSNVRAP